MNNCKLQTGKKIFLSVSFIILIITLFVISASGFENKFYISKTETFYVNPDTGKTDDEGSKNIAIGEGMCRSVIDEKALVEKEDGKTWITLRFNLISSIDSIVLATREEKNNSINYNKIKYDITQENTEKDYADFRIQVNDLNKLIQCKAFITPMSRDVCFYLKIDGSIIEGNEDFVVNVDMKSENKEENHVSKKNETKEEKKVKVEEILKVNDKQENEKEVVSNEEIVKESKKIHEVVPKKIKNQKDEIVKKTDFIGLEFFIILPLFISISVIMLIWRKKR